MSKKSINPENLLKNMDNLFKIIDKLEENKINTKNLVKQIKKINQEIIKNSPDNLDIEK
jgi:hypothetical protein